MIAHPAESVRFASELGETAFAARDALRGRDARTLARDLLQMTQEKFSAAFKGSPMKRAKLRGLKRNAAVVLGNVGTDVAEQFAQHLAELRKPPTPVNVDAIVGRTSDPGYDRWSRREPSDGSRRFHCAVTAWGGAIRRARSRLA